MAHLVTVAGLVLVSILGASSCSSDSGTARDRLPAGGAGGQSGEDGGEADAAGGASGAATCGDKLCTDGCCEWTAEVWKQSPPDTCATASGAMVTWYGCGPCGRLGLPCCWSRVADGITEEVCLGGTPILSADPPGYTRNDLCAPVTEPCDGG